MKATAPGSSQLRLFMKGSLVNSPAVVVLASSH
jgi:hypothetical protein